MSVNRDNGRDRENRIHCNKCGKGIKYIHHLYYEGICYHSYFSKRDRHTMAAEEGRENGQKE